MSFVDNSAHAVNPIAAGPAQAQASAAAAPSEGGVSFDDLIDIVNPLQHIPIVSTIYRAITGDTIKTFPKLAGDALYGGITGFIGSMADTIFEKITGKSVGDTVLAWVEHEFSSSSPPTAVASAGDASTGDATAPFVAANTALSAPATISSSILSGLSATPVNVAPAVRDVALAAPNAITASMLGSLAPTPVDFRPSEANTPVSVAPAVLDSIAVPGQDALINALTRSGVDQDIARRAADAYRRTLGVANSAVSTALH